jgi:hypothetical protein
VRENVLDTKTKAQKSIFDLKIVIGSSTGSKKSCVVSVESGELRVSFINKGQPKMVCHHDARNVHTKLPASHTNKRGKVREGISDMRSDI